MTLPFKIGLTTIFLSAIGGLGYTGISYFGKENKEISISDLINKEYKNILLKTQGDDDKTHWANSWTSYKDASLKLSIDIFGLDGWKNPNPDDLTEKLKEKCQKLRDLKVLNNNEDNYKNAIKYCARNVTINDQAKKEELKIIDTKSQENTTWNQIIQNKDKLTQHFTDLKIKPSSGQDIKAEDVKKGCETALTKSKSEEDYEKVYNSYKEVCVNKS